MTSTRGVPIGLSVVAVLIALAGLVFVPAQASAKKKKADLVVKSVDGGDSAEVGGVFVVVDLVKNIGKRTAGKSTVGYALSSDKQAGAGDQALPGTRQVPKLKKKKSSRGSTDLDMPASVDPGEYFLIACADSGKAVKEKSERNNCRSTPEKISVEDTPVLDPAELTLTPATHGFGSLLTGAASGPFTFMAKNTGGSTSGTLTSLVSGTGFSKGADSCNGATLAPNATCTVAVSFSPSAAGAASGTVGVAATGTADSSSLTGTGLDPASISIDPTDKAFDSTVVDGTSSATTFTVTNGGDVPSGALAVSLNGANPGEFRVVSADDECSGQTLAAGAGCTVDVVFEPTAAVARAASISITGTPGGTTAATLAGTGLAPAALEIVDAAGDPPGWDFGPALVGSFGGTGDHTFNVNNTGDVAAGDPSVAYSGGDTADFDFSAGSCFSVTSIPAGGTCTVSARFHPMTAGPKSTSLQVTSSPGGTATETPLTGQALTPAQLSVTPDPDDFGSTTVGVGVTHTFTVTNIGDANTNEIALSLSGTNANQYALVTGPTDHCTGFALTGGSSCTFEVTFTPTTPGAKTASAGATATTGGSDSSSLTGTGT